MAVAVAVAQKRQAGPATGVSLASGVADLGDVAVTGTTNNSLGITDSTTSLAASATFTGTGRALTSASQHAYFHATVFASHAGTLFIEQSLDSGASYQTVATQAITASVPVQLSTRLTGSFAATTRYRVRHVNGATAQTTFRLSSAFSR